MEGNTSKKKSNCKSCEKPVVEVENRYISETREETIIVADTNSSPETDEDIFE